MPLLSTWPSYSGPAAVGMTSDGPASPGSSGTNQSSSLEVGIGRQGIWDLERL